MGWRRSCVWQCGKSGESEGPSRVERGSDEAVRGIPRNKTGPGWEVRGPQEREDVLGPGASSGVGDPVARIPAGEGGRARVPSQGVGPGVRPGPEEREAVRTQGLR